MDELYSESQTVDGTNRCAGEADGRDRITKGKRGQEKIHDKRGADGVAGERHARKTGGWSFPSRGAGRSRSPALR